MEGGEKAQAISDRRAGIKTLEEKIPRLDDLIKDAEKRIANYNALSPKDQETWKNEYRKVCEQLERYYKYKERQDAH